LAGGFPRHEHEDPRRREDRDGATLISGNMRIDDQRQQDCASTSRQWRSAERQGPIQHSRSILGTLDIGSCLSALLAAYAANEVDAAPLKLLSRRPGVPAL
jgi:hypothetical protein